MKLRDIEPLFATLAAANPQPQSELEFSSVFELLAAVLLSAQATDVGVNKATRLLFVRAPTPHKMLALGLDELTEAVRTIGLFRTKARNLLATCRILVEQYAGEVPRNREALEALPGVGRKTANVVLNVAFGEPTMAVDTHVFRVSNRLGLAPGRTPLEVETQLLRRVPKHYADNAHHWLILHGRYICLARAPRCNVCALLPFCDHGKRMAAPTMGWGDAPHGEQAG
ncbi:MAG TPA: endonuclease III [Rubrivivax sp.]|nr:endonuclease III [Rubrivivax sp.]